jgi:cytochrome oxidase Cu insertion factor (SCO1/SenC/PrrC family)
MVVALAACQAPGEDDGGAPATLASPAASAASGTPVTQAAAQTQAAAADGAAAATLPEWQTLELVDVRSDERFTVADLAGKVVVIEPMAIWCSNCARQQREAAKALATLPRDDIVYISLDVDPSEQARDLAAYADERDFDWRFVVAERAMSRALAEEFGDQVLSPPSTPKIVVSQEGAVAGPNFGIQDAAAIEAEIRDLLS